MVGYRLSDRYPLTIRLKTSPAVRRGYIGHKYKSCAGSLSASTRQRPDEPGQGARMCQRHMRFSPATPLTMQQLPPGNIVLRNSPPYYNLRITSRWTDRAGTATRNNTLPAWCPFSAVRRVRDDGTLWIVICDYAGSGKEAQHPKRRKI